MLEQEYVSEQIINAILTNEDTVYLPRSMYVVVFLNM